MAIEIPRDEVSMRDEGLINLFRANPRKFGRGINAGAKSSLPFDTPVGSSLLEMANHTIEEERRTFPDSPDVVGKDFEVGVVVGVWLALKELEAGMTENPALQARIVA